MDAIDGWWTWMLHRPLVQWAKNRIVCVGQDLSVWTWDLSHGHVTTSVSMRTGVHSILSLHHIQDDDVQQCAALYCSDGRLLFVDVDTGCVSLEIKSGGERFMDMLVGCSRRVTVDRYN